MKEKEEVAFLQAVFVDTAATVTASSVFCIYYNKHSATIKFKTTEIMCISIKVKMLYAFFWVIPWHLNFMCQHF
jgi:hypothetical protein